MRLGGAGQNRVGEVENGLGRAVIVLQQNDRRRRVAALREVEDVAHRGGTEAEDRQRVVAQYLRPPQQKVVVVEERLSLLGLDIGGEQPAQLGFELGAPGKMPR